MRKFSWRREHQGQPGRQGRRHVAAIAGVAVGILGPSLLATSTANAGATAAAPRSAAVPWSSVGAGWALAEYSTGTMANRAPVTLELVSPAGAKYPLYTWPKSVNPPILTAWSPSKAEVLLRVLSGPMTTTVFDRLNLETGQITTLKVPIARRIVSYTLPTGAQFLADDNAGAATPTWTETVERIAKTGQPVKAIVALKHSASAPSLSMFPVYAPDGASIALAWGGGVAVVSNAGGSVKRLPVPAPGVTKTLGCEPARWWNSGTILATCGGQLWLVPANGAKPAALTRFGTGSNVAAWHLPSGLYVNTAAACITLLSKQNADGSLTTVSIPGLGGPRVLTAAGPRLLIGSTGCSDGQSNVGATVAWYNPGTKAKQVLFAKGVFGPVLAFPNVADAANNL
jgi:hypothetical protein